MCRHKVLLVLNAAGGKSEGHQKLLKCVEEKLGLKSFVESRGSELVPVVDETKSSNKNSATGEIIVLPHGSMPTVDAPRIKLSVTADDAVQVEVCDNGKLTVNDNVNDNNAFDDDDTNDGGFRSPKRRKISVSDLTNSNHVSAAEHVITTILVLVRSYNENLQRQMHDVELDVHGSIRDNFDIENKVIGIIGAGKVGYRIMERLVAFNPRKILYYDPKELPVKNVKKLNVVGLLINQRGDIVQRVDKLEEMLSHSDVVTINCPLNKDSKGLFNKELISHMKDGSFLINASKGGICIARDIKEATKSGKLAGYSGDVQHSEYEAHDLKDILEGLLQRRHGQKTN
ncbi:ZYRO0A01122p [Zygosaccharomyces rouxii]|uniref:ZYRO0A01122p n=1 Tax=Zygosaccharomyces rouxii (strain ATCC 2623 / CBS 732 / NBRC 1130 / NCYC 568 / NRRL Y-229) TaxID=559307 RepID=C5DP78_ZYGRC|nr:uncharacterized protein ZYRO0A01122g [Zygosaccharomyces rouxii]KAH9198991.1 hypothetical protein LQ764DRAFT_145146 [Zygosaccharomyces rouxii]CAR25489.1 ZYRO0A01122p [Zygosaccharomyces rouxii]